MLVKFVKDNFPDIELHGCTFHCSKAVYNKVVIIGLAISYVQDNDVNRLIKCLFCLPYLPHRDIIPVFSDLAAQVDSENNKKLKELFQYVESTKFQSSIWRPRNISAYLRLVRTNNDLECYHNRLNKRCKQGHPPLHKLARVLHREARLIKVTEKLISSSNVVMKWRNQTTERESISFVIFGIDMIMDF